MKKKLGFTLVEIMIVVAIIALLTAIAIPAFLQYRRDARTGVCVNNLRNIEHAKEAWAISRNLPETTAIPWSDIRSYIGQGLQYLYCPEVGTNRTYSTLRGVGGTDGGAAPADALSVGNVGTTATSRVQCPWKDNPAANQPGAHEYIPGGQRE